MYEFNSGRSLESGLTRVYEYVPQLLGALLILVIGYFVAAGLKNLTRRTLRRLGFDTALSKSAVGSMISRMIDGPSVFVSQIVFWLIFLGAISLAVTALNLPALTAFMASIYAYLPHVLAAVLIFLVASTVAAAATAFVQRVMGSTAPTAKLLSVVIPAVTMSIASFMILSELGIAENIVNITYAAIMAALALGLGLAFGLGGRDMASHLLDQAYDATKRNAGTIKADAHRASENTRHDADRLKRELK